MLYKKLLAVLIVGTFSCAAFAHSADEYVSCTFKPKISFAPKSFNFSKLGDAQEVHSDFGSTTNYKLDSDGHIAWAQGEKNLNCDLLDSECQFNSRWEFYNNNNGTWTIQQGLMQGAKSINVSDAICTSSTTNPHNNSPW